MEASDSTSKGMGKSHFFVEVLTKENIFVFSLSDGSEVPKHRNGTTDSTLTCGWMHPTTHAKSHQWQCVRAYKIPPWRGVKFIKVFFAAANVYRAILRSNPPLAEN